MTLRARSGENRLPLLLQFVQFRIWIGKWRPVRDGSSQAFDPGRREQRHLEGGDVVQEAHRWFAYDLRVRNQRGARLLLQRSEPCVVLIPALEVRAVRILAQDRDARSTGRINWRYAVRTCDGDVEDGHD